MLDDLRASGSIVFSSSSYRLIALGTAAALLAFYLSVPVLFIPGSSYRSVIMMMSLPEQLSTILLSALMGAVTAMQVFAWRNNAHRLSHAGAGLAGLVSGSLSVLFSTASCASCMSALFSLVGFGGLMFFFQHRSEMMALTFVILAASFYLTSKRIAGKCASCSVAQPAGEGKSGKEQKAAE